MTELFKGKMLYSNGTFADVPLAVEDGIVSVNTACDNIHEFNNLYILPGFADVHVHLRQPGFSYKETIKSGSLAAAHGGYTAICSMPNLNPVPDCPKNLAAQTEIIWNDAEIPVYPYGSITVGEKGEELSDMTGMAESVVAFSDDGKGIQNPELMKEAMEKAKAFGKIIVAHCEDNSLLHGGYIHKGEYAKLHNHRGISSESEWKPIERDLKIAKETGCKYHVCHISTNESVELIRQAKKDGVDVTCETGPHYLLLNDMDLKEEGRFKMNPPIRSELDRQALLEGIIDGTIDMIATDHAPHSQEEKSRGLEKSLMGIVGIETAFPLLYTHLVKKGIISFEKLIELISINPKRRFGISGGTNFGNTADFTVADLDSEYEIDSSKFYSMGKATPFDGYKVYGKIVHTFLHGKQIF